jgi:hypothetical protein
MAVMSGRSEYGELLYESSEIWISHGGDYEDRCDVF